MRRPESAFLRVNSSDHPRTVPNLKRRASIDGPRCDDCSFVVRRFDDDRSSSDPARRAQEIDPIGRHKAPLPEREHDLGPRLCLSAGTQLSAWRVAGAWRRAGWAAVGRLGDNRQRRRVLNSSHPWQSRRSGLTCRSRRRNEQRLTAMPTNHFLESLSESELKAIEPKLTKVALKTGECLVTRGDNVGFVYLPTSSIVSVITTMLDGTSVESRTIGRESGFGLLHALGSRYSYDHVEVQVSGEAFRLSTADLDAAAENSVSLRRHIVEHAQATLAQAAQAAACNALHGVRQRMCKWLLLTRDRLGSDVVPLTQEHLSIMLGVQRTTVTAIAAALQADGLIKNSRGRIQILDGDRMQSCACECYDQVEKAVSRLLS